MNPKVGGEKPQSQYEAPAFNSEQYDSNSETQETLTNSPESASHQPAAPVIVVPVAPTVVIPDDTTADSSAVTSQDDQAARSKDADTIEKIWVDRAKAIISQTKDDPFAQKNEMSKVKAEYIQKRFNKKLKIDDAVS